MGRQGDPGKKAKEDWGSAGNGQVRPLALGLYPQVGADLLESDLQLPAQNEPLDNLNWCYVGISAQKGLRLKFRQWVSNQDPPDGDWRQPRMLPDGGIRGNFQEALGCD
jgi:hypothetical protein